MKWIFSLDFGLHIKSSEILKIILGRIFEIIFYFLFLYWYAFHHLLIYIRNHIIPRNNYVHKELSPQMIIFAYLIKSYLSKLINYTIFLAKWSHIHEQWLLHLFVGIALLFLYCKLYKYFSMDKCKILKIPINGK